MLAKLSQVFRCYFIPGLVFQSVVVGGGYGTGREIVEFFMLHGPMGGLLGMLVSCCVWGLVLAVAFEFARLTKSYNYRSFFQHLLGPLWPLFELNYLLIALLVLAVLGSASGEIVFSTFGIPAVYGSIFLMLMVGTLAFWGSKTIEKFLTLWSVFLYLTYFVLLIWVLNSSTGHIAQVFADSDTSGGWLVDGVRYSAYNLVALAAVLFVVPHFKKRRQAIGAGLMAGGVAILPGMFVFVTLLAAYPQITEAPVPIISILEKLQSAWFPLVFQIMLFGTFIETGTGIIHAINERIASTFVDKQRRYPNWLRALTALVSLSFATFLADKFGIISLIADGYGLLSYGYIAIVVVPLMTVGLITIVKKARH